EPVQAATEKAVGGPGVKAGQDRGRCQQEGVQATDSVEDRHQAFPEPFVSDPRLAGEREREWIGVDELACRENPVSRRGVPERPRIAEEPASSHDHEEQPDPQEESGFCPPESPQHAQWTLRSLMPVLDLSNRPLCPTRGGQPGQCQYCRHPDELDVPKTQQAYQWKMEVWNEHQGQKQSRC